MALNLEQLTAQALQLPAASRALLADQLVESLANANPDELSTLWATEASRRLEEIRTGQILPIPGNEVLAEARRRVGRVRPSTFTRKPASNISPPSNSTKSVAPASVPASPSR